MTTMLKVEGMTCGHCKATVEKALLGVSGVSGATVDLDSGVVSVAHDDDLGTDALKSAVASAGYSVIGVSN